MRLCDTSGVDQETASQTYFLCLLFYVGCTASVDLDPDTFGDDDGLTAYALPSRFGTRPEILGGYLRALASPDGSAIFRARQLLGAPRLVRAFPSIVAAVCEVGRMLTDPAAKAEIAIDLARPPQTWLSGPDGEEGRRTLRLEPWPG